MWSLCAALLEVRDNTLTITPIKKGLGQQQIKLPFSAETKSVQLPFCELCPPCLHSFK